MQGLVYLETTVFSPYYEERTSPDILARKEWTRRWWDKCRTEYTLVTSTAVFDELDRGTYPHKEPARTMAGMVPILPVTHEIADIITVYTKHHLMPADPAGDALHLALASYHKCDYLLTWNCQHLANANKFGHLQKINAMLGLFVPILTTPLGLLGEYGDETK